MPFTSKSGIIAADIRADYLFGLVAHVKKVSSLSDTYIENKIREAEDDFERDLNIFLSAKRIKCEPQVGDTDWDYKEPAYDYETDFFSGERWGFLRLRKYPIQSVESIVFAFPTLDTKVFNVPPSWIKVDDQFGFVRLVPTQAAIYASFTGFIFSLISGGRSLPQSLFVNYTAGFKDQATLKQDHTDILEHLKRCMVLNILDDAFVPGSFSQSGDGLTQSFSVELSKYREQVEARRTKLRNKIKGIRMIAV